MVFFLKSLLKTTALLSSKGIRLRRSLSSSVIKDRAASIASLKELVSQIRVYDEIDLEAADLDWDSILDKKSFDHINENIANRKSNCDLSTLHKYFDDFEKLLNNQTHFLLDFEIEKLVNKIYFKAIQLPNRTHETTPIGDYEKAENVLQKGDRIEKAPTVDYISNLFGWLQEGQLTHFSTPRAYILKKELADLEVALIRYTQKYLAEKGFIFVTVPDILHHSIIESCGFPTTGERNQVYKLDYLNEYGKYCLSGTSEMSLGGLVKNTVVDEKELPIKLCALSRCFRAEVSGSEREGKLYRLHEFTKVEMFVLTRGVKEASDAMLEQLKNYQIELFSDLGLHFRVLDMPTLELGAPAYKKYDIEAWMPGTQFYGEISSTSNCTDFQSRRLHIKSSKNKDDDSVPKDFVHTLNGTACAIPRMLTAIVESNWDMKNKLVHIPMKLRPYLNNKECFRVPKDFRKAKPLRGRIEHLNT